MKKLLTIATLAMLSSSTLVLANSGPAPMPAAPAPAPMAKKGAFAGMLVGGQLGYATGTGRYTETELLAPLRTARSDMGGCGFLGGLNMSYNMQWNKTVLGLETTFNWSGLKGKGQTIPLIGSSLVENELKQKHAWDVALRLGMTPADNVLAYMKLGVAFSKWDSRTVNASIGSNRASKTLTGFQAGLGTDFAMGDRFSVGAEYTFTQYGSFRYNLTDQIANHRVTVKPHANSFMLHAKFKIF